ncbi:thiosulfate reductase PhsA [Campylobacter sp. RM12651]|uniref:thiosulfate reductase PhsA n=1 Tax=Campylobacter sp. RM12651 TaxID=1660079 RepID=UPI001EFC01D2|nr:thiosulfate reductase PhsA [Campylobacter sp. RM12651]ULO04378.1 putative thiosulfate/polysulfide reductase, molybdenum-binding subunit [Campylobacter sp. RM12651]
MQRREFLKGSAFLGSLACINPVLSANAFTKGDKKSVFSVCEMCSTRCPIEISVKDNKGVFINGNPKFSTNKTSVCARGGAGINQLYDKNRLIKPLIRVGKRGENKWREASWDEALNLVATKLNEIKEKHGASSVIFTSKAGESHTHMSNFACAYGSPNIFSHYSSCPITYNMVLEHTYGGGLSRDFANAKYIVNFGHNLFEGIVISDAKKLAKFAAASDTKLLVLEPRFSVVAAKADEWLPIKPGTDVAFLMALIHIWLRDEKYDKEFVNEYCIGLDELKASVKDTSPKWQESITGISADTIERIADEIYKAAPKVVIDWGHKTTTTYAEYQRTRAIAIANALMGNYEKKGGIHTSKNTNTLNKIIGEDIFPTLDNPSNVFKVPNTPRIDGAGEVGNKNYFVSRKHGVLMDIAPAILSKKPYPIKAWVNTRFNHLVNVANVNESLKAINELDFIVSIDIYLNDFSNLADVVLPESSYLERDESIATIGNGYYMRNKAVEVIGDTKSGFDIFRKLASMMKIDELYTYTTIDEYRMQQAKGNVDLLANLKKDGIVTYKVPSLYLREPKTIKEFAKTYPQIKDKIDSNGELSSLINFKTPSKKIELFIEKVENLFPTHGCLNTTDYDVFKNHEFCLTSGKTPIHTNAHTQNIPILNELMSESPVWINETKAKELGFKDGDLVYLENEFGKIQVKLMLTQGIRPDTLFIYHGFGRNTPALKNIHEIGANDSIVLGSRSGYVCSTMVTNIGVDIKRA